MSMRTYGYEGYGFAEKSIENLERVKKFIREKASKRVRYVMQESGYQDFKTVEEFEDACDINFNTYCISAILSETLSDITEQDVRPLYDEDDGWKILLMPRYPWKSNKQIDQKEYDRIATEYAQAFYGPHSFKLDYENVSWCC